jgi:hypothetical protein
MENGSSMKNVEFIKPVADEEIAKSIKDSSRQNGTVKRYHIHVLKDICISNRDIKMRLFT